MTPYILIADDDDDVRDVFDEIISLMNYPVRTATNGLEALEYIREEIPGLLILDMMMPEMSGFDVLEALNDDPSIPAIPIIVISAVPAQTLEKLPGVSRVLPKTGFKVPELISTVTELYPA